MEVEENNTSTHLTIRVFPGLHDFCFSIDQTITLEIIGITITIIIIIITTIIKLRREMKNKDEKTSREVARNRR